MVRAFVEVITGTVGAVGVVGDDSVVSILIGFDGGSGVEAAATTGVGVAIVVDGVDGLVSIGSGSGSLLSISSFTLPESVVTLDGL